MGRQSTYTKEVGDEICARLAGGESLFHICDSEGSEFPERKTVRKWKEDHPEFAAQYARARVEQADAMDELILKTADACTPETANADRVKIGAYQWRAERLNNKQYGARQVIAGDPEAPLMASTESLTPDQLRAIAAIKLEQR